MKVCLKLTSSRLLYTVTIIIKLKPGLMYYSFSPLVFLDPFLSCLSKHAQSKSLKKKNKPSVLRASGLLFILTTISALEISIVLLNL